MSYVLSKKTVSTAKGVGVSSEKYPKLHLVDVMSDTWYPIPPPVITLVLRVSSHFGAPFLFGAHGPKGPNGKLCRMYVQTCIRVK